MSTDQVTITWSTHTHALETGRATIDGETYAWTATAAGHSWVVGIIQPGQPGMLKGLVAHRASISSKIEELIRGKRNGTITPTLI